MPHSERRMDNIRASVQAVLRTCCCTPFLLLLRGHFSVNILAFCGSLREVVNPLGSVTVTHLRDDVLGTHTAAPYYERFYHHVKVE